MSLDPITAGLDLLGTLARIVESAQAGQTTPAEAIAAARKALGADPFAGMAAEDAARRARLAAAARILRAATVPPALLSPDLAGAIAALVEHHDPQPGSVTDAVRLHAERAERSDEVTREMPLHGGKP